MTREEIISHLESKTIKNELGCWLWTGTITNDGHGTTEYRGTLVHRLSAHLFLDLDLDSGMQALHKIICPNKNCWNPEHLYIGTNQENRTDTVRTGNIFSPIAIINKLKTHCINGHPLEGDNLDLSEKGRRRCKTCKHKSAKKHYELNRFKPRKK